MKKVFVMLPAYNEEENIGELLDKWQEQCDEFNKRGYELNIYVINDCSTDKTVDVVNLKKEIYTNVNIINHTVNQGLSGGLNTGIKFFGENATEGDLLITMDADNTHDPIYSVQMLDEIEKGFDCIIASRYQKGANVCGLSKTRKVMSDLAGIWYRFLLNVPNVKDYTCGYRIYKFDIIKNLIGKYGENPVKDKSFACMMELLYKVYQVGATFSEIPFELRYDNKKGKSKMNVSYTAMKSIGVSILLSRKEIIYQIFLLIFALFLSLGTNYSPLNRNILRS